MRTGAAVLAAVLAASVAALPGALAAQTVEVPLDGAVWEFGGDSRIGEWDGEPALLMRIGGARIAGTSIGDGTVELDVILPERRAFFGLELRQGPEGHAEDVYLRAHKSGHPDALQYNPDFHGRGQWQLHHGPDATAGVTFTPGEWHRVRVELSGGQAAVFVGDEAEPKLIVPHLRSGRTEGAVELWANQPGAGEGDPWTAVVRNVRVRPGETTWSFTGPEDAPPPAGLVERWSLSEPFQAEGEIVELPPEVVDGPWREVAAGPDGLLSIDRWIDKPANPASVLAGLEIRADEPRTVRLDLGFSDDASVFLDGRLVYSGRHGYSYNFPRRQGLITLDQATLHLPLEAGEHELVVAVTDAFGGWGLMARMEDRTGIRISPR